MCVSTILVTGLMSPLRAVLRRLCPGPEGENFWMRFTVLMLYLSPLLVALVFGVPYSTVLETLDAGQLAQRVLSSTLFGAFAALAGIGMRMGTLRMPPVREFVEFAIRLATWPASRSCRASGSRSAWRTRARTASTR
ncbi:MAG: hypothetical protein HC872_09800 [Gammaproteobacteria bacterium]|nr:hypothetical protein [Gammaproteobacteria bacterium]